MGVYSNIEQSQAKQDVCFTRNLHRQNHLYWTLILTSAVAVVKGALTVAIHVGTLQYMDSCTVCSLSVRCIIITQLLRNEMECKKWIRQALPTVHCMSIHSLYITCVTRFLLHICIKTRGSKNPGTDRNVGEYPPWPTIHKYVACGFYVHAHV